MSEDDKGGASLPKFELVTDGDPRGQPVPYYRGLVAVVARSPYIAIVTADGSTMPSDRWEEVGRLLAAAPELLEALEECLREHGGFTIKGECERRARAAIAKATASSPTTLLSDSTK